MFSPSSLRHTFYYTKQQSGNLPGSLLVISFHQLLGDCQFFQSLRAYMAGPTHPVSPPLLPHSRRLPAGGSPQTSLQGSISLMVLTTYLMTHAASSIGRRHTDICHRVCSASVAGFAAHCQDLEITPPTLTVSVMSLFCC